MGPLSLNVEGFSKGHMKLTKLMALAFGLSMMFGVGAAFAQYGPPPPPQQGPPPGYQQPGPGGWDAPPPQYQDEFTRRGFHDGIEGARKDYENHRPPSPANRDEFRHPNFIPPPYRREYREAFKRGYAMAVRHFQGGPGPYGPPR
jgi:hypothetical protein